MVNSIVNRAVSFFQWLWFEYTIFTALYMLGQREKIIFSNTSCLYLSEHSFLQSANSVNFYFQLVS